MPNIDLWKLSYGVTVKAKDGTKYNIIEYIQELGWDENENELSTKITFKARNNKTAKGYISTICKPGYTVIVYANAGSGAKEVARGRIVNWKNSRSSDIHDADIVCYDDLYNLQKSQDYFYFASGKTAKARIKRILGRWNVPIGKYDGPKCRLGKKKYEAKYLADILLDILKKAGKKTGTKYIIRLVKGKVEVIKRGSNETVYLFDSSNSISRERTKSTADMITKVKIVGKNKKAKRPKKITVLNGKTYYGVRQRIYNKDDEESVKEAKKSAKGILKKDGKIKIEGRLQTPDVPFLKKGDKVRLGFKTLKGFYYVTSVSHDADTKTMTLTVHK